MQCEVLRQEIELLKDQGGSGDSGAGLGRDKGYYRRPELAVKYVFRVFKKSTRFTSIFTLIIRFSRGC